MALGAGAVPAGEHKPGLRLHPHPVTPDDSRGLPVRRGWWLPRGGGGGGWAVRALRYRFLERITWVNWKVPPGGWAVRALRYRS